MLKAEDAAFLSFTSTGLFVQEFVPGGTVAFVADPSVPADVGAAAVVVLAFVHGCRKRGARTGGKETGRERRSESDSLFLTEQLSLDETQRKCLCLVLIILPG